MFDRKISSTFFLFRFIFTEYGKVSTAEGDKASAVMIAELATHVEQTFGLAATRLCRALHSKSSFGEKLKLFTSFRFVSFRRFESTSISIFVLHSSVYFRISSNRFDDHVDRSRVDLS